MNNSDGTGSAVNHSEGGGDSDHSRLDNRVLQPTTKYYVAIPTLSAPYTWFLHPWADQLCFVCVKNVKDLIFTHWGAPGAQNHVYAQRVNPGFRKSQKNGALHQRDARAVSPHRMILICPDFKIGCFATHIAGVCDELVLAQLSVTTRSDH